MKNMSPAVIEAVLTALNDTDEVRTEMIRVRVTPAQKSGLAKCAAAASQRTATYAHNVLMGAMTAHVRPRPPERTGAIRRPLVRPVRTLMCRRQV